MRSIYDIIEEECPMGVEHLSLGEVGEFIRGSGIQKSDFVPAGMGCIHYGQIHTSYGTWADKTISFVNPELAQKSRRARPGDLVIATTSEDDLAVGKAVAWLGDTEVAVSTDALIFRHTLNAKFVSYFFQTAEFQSQKRPYITGTKVRRISRDGFAKIVIPVPSLKLQSEIVQMLDALHELEVELEVELQAELQARRKQYMHYREQLFSFEVPT